MPIRDARRPRPGRALALTFALTLASGATAAPVAAQSGALRPMPIDTFTLANGLRVIVSEDHSDPIVAVSMWYGVGSANETPGRTGFAHFFEHLLFSPTENMGPGEYDRLVTQAGGVMNGTTDADRTAYWEILPSNQLRLALWAHAERMSRLELSDSAFQASREIVKEERRQRIDNQPYGTAQLAVDSLSTDWAPYRHPPIGSMADLDAATVNDAREFYRRWYVPNNAVLAVVGDVDAAQLRAAVREYLGPIPRGAPSSPLPAAPAVPRATGERRLEVADPFAQLPLVWIAYTIPPADAADAYALSLLSTILSAGESSRLRARLMQKERAALDVVAFTTTRVGPGTMMLGAIPNLGIDVERMETMIDEEIARIRDEGVTEAELVRAKRQQRVAEVTSRLRVQTKADLLQAAQLHHRDPFRANDDLARYEAVTAEDVRRVARAYLTPANRAVVVARPARGGK